MRPTNLISIVFCLVLTSPCLGQVNDSFTDGNYLSAPEWKGDTAKFDVASFELWLNAPAITDVAFLSTASTVMLNTEWQFYNRMEFDPSSANFCRFYLVSDQRNFNAPNVNGYYVELGRINDEISLYKVENGTSTKIIDGPDNMLTALLCSTRVKVTRTGNLWELLVDTTGSNSFLSLGNFLEGSISSNYFLGAYCKYTSTRSDKFFFDDVVANGTSWVDATDPYIVSHTAVGNLLTLTLNEPVASADLNPINFSLDNGLTVLTVMEDSLNCKKIHITASANFLNDVSYHLNITSLNDFQGNVANAINYPFILHTVVPGEIVINEIFADPSPQISLPNTEFIELKNNSEYPIDLQNWILKIGATSKTLLPTVLNPGDFIILTDINDTTLFNTSIKKMGVFGFPSITNTGTTIELLDTGVNTIDFIQFDLNWYHDPAKDDGGYTLERINPNEFCMLMDNWKASGNVNGGTPGFENAVYDSLFVNINASSFWIDSVHVLVVFNQLMNPATLVLGNFTLQNLMGVQVLSNDSCVLILNAPLTTNTNFDLILSSALMDCEDNALGGSLIIPVVNYSPQLFDVLIDELMLDETPMVSLPAAEYIELINTRPFPIHLLGYNLIVNGANYTLGNSTIPADSFIVVVDENNISLFSGINTAGIVGFGGLTNEEGLVELYHANGDLLHAVNYDIDYYDVSGKENGGWSLEMIDTSKPCLQNINWTASNDISGGSPGRKNSYSTAIPDIQKVHALKTGLLGSDTLLVYFDESVLPSSFTLADVTVSGGNAVTNINYGSALLDVYQLKLQNSIIPDTTYYLRLQNVEDCEGNTIGTDSLPFSIPVFPNNFDLVINEILADPTSNCIDYVEIINRGAHSIDLSQVIMGEGDTSSFFLTNFMLIHNQSLLLHPGEYLLVSEDHEKIMNCYAMPDSTSYWDITSLPDFANTSGVVGISTFNQQWLDMFAYNEEMHFSTLNSTDGVSLERLDINGATQNKMNWHSAASTVGFGTPGYKNSQFSPDILISDDFTIEPEVFSPDNDGYKDYVTIYYQLANNGFMANLRIFDQAGRLEKYLVNNETLGTSGQFVWDGTNDAGGKVNVGIHIIYFEITGPNGEILQFKKTVVVGAKL